MITEERQREIIAEREQWEDDNYTKLINCPEHPGQHWALLYEWGHRWGGQWECPKGFNDTHEHDPEHYEIESVEPWPTGPMDNPTPRDVYVCGGPEGCGLTIDFDVANPEVDRAEAAIDREIDEARGK